MSEADAQELRELCEDVLSGRVKVEAFHQGDDIPFEAALAVRRSWELQA